MSVSYKDIDELSNKSTLAGTEKLPVSDTEYITPNQIAGLVNVPTVDSSINNASTNALQNSTITETFLRGKQMSPTSIEDGKYLKRDGTEGSSGSYHYMKYNVTAGEHYAITSYFSSSYTTGLMRIVVWLNDNNEVVGYDERGNKSSSAVSYYDELVVAPTGATKAALNCYKTSSSQSFKFVAAPSPDCVLCTSQTLTSDEKAQARTNIGAAAASDIPDSLSDLSEDSTHRVVTDTEKSTWNGKQNAITISSSEPTSVDGSNGDIWIVV